MSNRIDAAFDALRASQKRAFIAYICCGDPDLSSTVELALALEEAGVDLIELGIPFSDPLADGLVNQLAAQRALEAGMTTAGVLETIRNIRRHSEIPLVLFTYLNPVYAYGFTGFDRDAAEAGADGILILDLPPDEAARHAELSGQRALRQIRLIAPTTPRERIAVIAAASQGFIYYVSREGVTGEQDSIALTIGDQLALIRAAAATPVAVGFGIHTPDQARRVAALADGVVVGSAIVRRIAEHGRGPGLAAAVREFVNPLVEAVKSI
ncbi:MAG TPA: tryptophan synthase subunit alpha [Verrucomicrobiales bacterium]|nr:tryptophan synthase subunit alpha [Verrucomicrobiales bacterium]